MPGIRGGNDQGVGSALTGLAVLAAVLSGILWVIARAGHHRSASGGPDAASADADARAGAAPGHPGAGGAAEGHRVGYARLRAVLAGHPAGSGRATSAGRAAPAGRATSAGRAAPAGRPPGPVRVRSRLVFLRRTPRAFVLDAVLVDIRDGDGWDSPARSVTGRMAVTDDPGPRGPAVDDPGAARRGPVTDDPGAARRGPVTDDPGGRGPSAGDRAGDDAATAVAGHVASGVPFTIALRLPGTDWLATRVEKTFTEWSEGGDLVTIDLTEHKGQPRATVASRGWAIRLDLAGTSGLPVASR